MSAGSIGNAAYPNLAILGTGGEVLAVGAEADAANVEVPCAGSRLVKQDAGLGASLGVVDLGCAVTASSEPLSVVRELDAANDSVMDEGVDERHVEDLFGSLRPDGEPV